MTWPRRRSAEEWPSSLGLIVSARKEMGTAWVSRELESKRRAVYENVAAGGAGN